MWGCGGMRCPGSLAPAHLGGLAGDGRHAADSGGGGGREGAAIGAGLAAGSKDDPADVQRTAAQAAPLLLEGRTCLCLFSSLSDHTMYTCCHATHDCCIAGVNRQ